MKIPDLDTLKSMSLEEFAEYILNIPVSERRNLELDFSVLGEEKKYLLEFAKCYGPGIFYFEDMFPIVSLNNIIISSVEKTIREYEEREARRYATKTAKQIKLELEKIKTKKELKDWYLKRYPDHSYIEELDKNRCFYRFLYWKNGTKGNKNIDKIKKFIIREVWIENYISGLKVVY